MVNDAHIKYMFANNMIAQLRVGERKDDLGDLTYSYINSSASAKIRKKSGKEFYSLSFLLPLGDDFSLVGVRTSKRENIDTLTDRILPSGTVVALDNRFSTKFDSTEMLLRFNGSYGMVSVGVKDLDVPSQNLLNQSSTVRNITVKSPASVTKREDYSLQGYIDYLYSSESNGFILGGGIESNAFLDWNGNVREEYYNFLVGLDCLEVVHCDFAHNEFLTLPLVGRDSLRVQQGGIYKSKSDFLPYSQVKLNGVSFNFDLKDWALLVGGNQVDIATPQLIGPRGQLFYRPDFQELEYGAELAGSPGILDSLVLWYQLSESETDYQARGRSAADIPVSFDVELFGITIEKSFNNRYFFRANIDSLDQKYVLPNAQNDTFSRTRVRFVNVDINLSYVVSSELTVSFSGLNIFGNSKDVIEGALSNSVGERVGGVDRYVAERVTSLSATLSF